MAQRRRIDAIPWNLTVWSVPGSSIGAPLGTQSLADSPEVIQWTRYPAEHD